MHARSVFQKRLSKYPLNALWLLEFKARKTAKEKTNGLVSLNANSIMCVFLMKMMLQHICIAITFRGYKNGWVPFPSYVVYSIELEWETCIDRQSIATLHPFFSGVRYAGLIMCEKNEGRENGSQGSDSVFDWQLTAKLEMIKTLRKSWKLTR